MAGLAELAYLYLHGNALTGPIPARLGGLAKLEYLSLSANRLSGTVPRELEGLPALVALSLRGNPISADQKTMLMKALPNCKITF